MAYRIAINGYGRIGRMVLRAFYEGAAAYEGSGRASAQKDRAPLQIVAINDLADAETVAHLTKYDSTHGRFPGQVERRRGSLWVNGDLIRLHATPDIGALPWRALGINLVMECSGAFTDRHTAERHLAAGAGKVLFSQPAAPDVDATVVYGINHQSLTAEQRILSNASCTTNCIVPVLHTVHAAFGIESGLITTIHSAMSDQPVLDGYHGRDLRRSRSALRSIVPVDTALAVGIARILPELAGRFEAQALRVPVLNVSAMDLSVKLAQPTTPAEVRRVLKRAAARLPANVLGLTEEPLASCDFNHDSRSAIVDLNQLRLATDNHLKLLLWFDNEWAYANRMLDVAAHLQALE